MDVEDIELRLDDVLESLMTDRLVTYLATPLTNCSPEETCANEDIRNAVKRILCPRFEVYDPAEHTPPGTKHDAEDVYLLDHNRTRTADLVFFHVTQPSLGVAIESQIAAEATIPRVIAWRRGAQVSRMFRGVFNHTIAEIEYDDLDDFVEKLQAALPTIVEATVASAHRRNPLVARIASAKLGREIFKGRIVLGKTIDELAAATDIRTRMLMQIERSMELSACLSLIQLMRITQELNAIVMIGGEGIPSIHGKDDDLPENKRQSLEALVDFVVSNKPWIKDPRIQEMWATYNELANTRYRPSAGQAQKELVYSADDWRNLYTKFYGLF
ncbi:MAG: hypothetical protein A49_22350 [Methyloceanibacter sp.]|nr:MAG: hypothetical protein A49_22350 [Methyloceanibacter sp.]